MLISTKEPNLFKNSCYVTIDNADADFLVGAEHIIVMARTVFPRIKSAIWIAGSAINVFGTAGTSGVLEPFTELASVFTNMVEIAFFFHPRTMALGGLI